MFSVTLPFNLSVDSYNLQGKTLKPLSRPRKWLYENGLQVIHIYLTNEQNSGNFFKYLLLLLWSLVLQEHNTSFEDSEKKLLSTKVIIEKQNALLNEVTVEPWLKNFASKNWFCCEASKLKYLHTLLSLASGECQEQNRFEQEIKSIPIIFDKTDEVSSQGWLGLDARYFSYSCNMFCFGFASWIPTQNLNLLCHSMVATACILRAMNEFSDSSWTSS